MVNYTGYGMGDVYTPPYETKTNELAVRITSWHKHSHINLFAADVLNLMIDLGMLTKEDAERLIKDKNIPFPVLPTPHI